MAPGEVWKYDFQGLVGSEPDKERHAVVVQGDFVRGLETTLVVPCSEKIERRRQGTAVFLPAHETGLPIDLVALCHLVFPADIVRRSGTTAAAWVGDVTLEKIRLVLADLLGITAETFVADVGPGE